MADIRGIINRIGGFVAVAAVLTFGAPAALAATHSSYCARWAGAQLDPYDLNVMRSSVSASARLAVAQRLRSLEAECRAGLHHSSPAIHHSSPAK